MQITTDLSTNISESENRLPDVKTNSTPFPIDALSPVLRDIVTAVSEVYQIPPGMPAMAALAINGAAAGKRYKLIEAVNGQESYANLYVIVAAERGAGKGSVAKTLIKPLEEAGQQMERAFASKKAKLEAESDVLNAEIKLMLKALHKNPASRDEIMKEVEKKKHRLEAIRPGGRPILAPSFIEGNTTSEALAASLSTGDQAIFSFSPEAGELLRVALGKYNSSENGDFDLLLSGWSSEAVNLNRIGRGRASLCPTISALWFAQPLILKELLANREALQRGLTARLLIFDSEIVLRHDDGVRRVIPNAIIEEWSKYIQHLLQDRPTASSFDVRCSAEAKETFRGFHNRSVDLRLDKYADVEGELSRWRENAIRVALNLWMADGLGGELTADQARRGAQIVEWAETSYLNLLDQERRVQRFSRVEELRALLVNQSDKTATLRDLVNRHGFTQSEVRRLAEEFPDKITIVKKAVGAQGGRPSEMAIIPTPAYQGLQLLPDGR